MPDKPFPNILLGLDFGMKKIGVAVGQMLTKHATPLPAIKSRDGIPDWQSFEKIIKTWQIEGIVVGIPYNMDGSAQETTYAAQKFARKLNARFQLPIFYVDERLSTIEARTLQKKSSESIDSLAAKIILESWFSQQENNHV